MLGEIFPYYTNFIVSRIKYTVNIHLIMEKKLFYVKYLIEIFSDKISYNELLKSYFYRLENRNRSFFTI